MEKRIKNRNKQSWVLPDSTIINIKERELYLSVSKRYGYEEYLKPIYEKFSGKKWPFRKDSDWNDKNIKKVLDFKRYFKNIPEWLEGEVPEANTNEDYVSVYDDGVHKGVAFYLEDRRDYGFVSPLYFIDAYTSNPFPKAQELWKSFVCTFAAYISFVCKTYYGAESFERSKNDFNQEEYTLDNGDPEDKPFVPFEKELHKKAYDQITKLIKSAGKPDGLIKKLEKQKEQAFVLGCPELINLIQQIINDHNQFGWHRRIPNQDQQDGYIQSLYVHGCNNDCIDIIDGYLKHYDMENGVVGCTLEYAVVTTDLEYYLISSDETQGNLQFIVTQINKYDKSKRNKNAVVRRLKRFLVQS
jgi:hypothetical protein